jgi:hypothetical protein
MMHIPTILAVFHFSLHVVMLLTKKLPRPDAVAKAKRASRLLVDAAASQMEGGKISINAQCGDIYEYCACFQVIDGRDHALGSMVYDRCLHGRNKGKPEPGYISSMQNVFSFLALQLGKEVHVSPGRTRP